MLKQKFSLFVCVLGFSLFCEKDAWGGEYCTISMEDTQETSQRNSIAPFLPVKQNRANLLANAESLRSQNNPNSILAENVHGRRQFQMSIFLPPPSLPFKHGKNNLPAREKELIAAKADPSRKELEEMQVKISQFNEREEATTALYREALEEISFLRKQNTSFWRDAPMRGTLLSLGVLLGTVVGFAISEMYREKTSQ